MTLKPKVAPINASDLHNDVVELKERFEHMDVRQTSVEYKLDEILAIIGPEGFIRKHGMRAVAAIVGAAIYAGLIDGKMAIFFSKLLGI